MYTQMFVNVIEKIFSGFDVDADTQILKTLAKHWEQEVFIIKKSKYFITLFSLWNIFLIILIALINIGLFFLTDILPFSFRIILSGLLFLNLIIRLITTISYLRMYSKTYNVFKIMPAKDWIPILKKWDKLFRSFFDKTIWLILFYISIVILFLVWSFFLIKKIDTINWIVIVANLVLFIRQLQQIIKLLKNFINLEMDFVIVTKDHIKHYDQQKLWVKTKTLDVEKIKTIKSTKTWKLRSLLNFGEIYILTEWDNSSQADLHLKYIVKPEQIEWLLNDLRQKKKNTDKN